MSDLTRISPSKLRTFDECPKRFEFRYVQGIPETDKTYFEMGRKVEADLYLLLEGKVPEDGYSKVLAEAIYANADFRKLVDGKKLVFQNEIKTDDFIGYTDIETDEDVIDVKTTSANITAESVKDYRWQAKGYYKHTWKPVTFVIVNKTTRKVQVIKIVPKDLRDYEDKITELRLAMELGVFNPNPSFACKFCDYYTFCPK